MKITNTTKAKVEYFLSTKMICSDCGTREALESIGVSETEQNEILKTIHRYKRNINE